MMGLLREEYNVSEMVMGNELTGKKLLILGATANEIPLVKRARELGVYVITTDYNTDYNKSPAKSAANEFWNISWSDLDELECLCHKHHVDGVTAGFSEIRVDNMMQLCERLGFPSYINRKQLEITRNKILFKEECRKNNIPTIKEYCSIDDVDAFPVIVKPTDRAGSIGVSIANDRDELEVAFRIAMEKSIEKKVIIEEYITDAVEMDVHYAIQDGQITLLTTDDIIAAAGNAKDRKVVQSAWMYPSKYHEAFLSKVDSKMRKMIRNMGVQNGTIFFSGFVNSKSDFSFFECGFRLWGEQEFTYDYLCGNLNYLDIYIYHALLGKTSDIEKNRQGNPKLKGVAINLYVKGGVISEIKGLDQESLGANCCLCINDSYIGQKCSFDNAILTKAGLIGFANRNPNALYNDVLKTYKTVFVLDQNGNNMLYDQIDANLIKLWWKE